MQVHEDSSNTGDGCFGFVPWPRFWQVQPENEQQNYANATSFHLISFYSKVMAGIILLSQSCSVWTGEDWKDVVSVVSEEQPPSAEVGELVLLVFANNFLPEDLKPRASCLSAVLGKSISPTILKKCAESMFHIDLHTWILIQSLMIPKLLRDSNESDGLFVEVELRDAMPMEHAFRYEDQVVVEFDDEDDMSGVSFKERIRRKLQDLLMGYKEMLRRADQRCKEALALLRAAREAQDDRGASVEEYSEMLVMQTAEKDWVELRIRAVEKAMAGEILDDFHDMDKEEQQDIMGVEVPGEIDFATNDMVQEFLDFDTAIH